MVFSKLLCQLVVTVPLDHLERCAPAILERPCPLFQRRSAHNDKSAIDLSLQLLLRCERKLGL